MYLQYDLVQADGNHPTSKIMSIDPKCFLWPLCKLPLGPCPQANTHLTQQSVLFCLASFGRHGALRCCHFVTAAVSLSRRGPLYGHKQQTVSHSPAKGQRDCFRFGAVANKAAMHVHVKVFN